MTRRQRVGAWFVRQANAVAGVTAVVLLAVTVLAIPALLSLHAALANLELLPALVAFVVAGWVLTVRMPANPVGWMLLLTALGMGMLSSGALSGWLIQHDVSAGRQIAAITGTCFVFIVGGLALLLPLLFPDGRLPSNRRRWRIVLWCDLGYMVFATFNIFDRGPLDLPLAYKVQNPFGTGAESHLSALVAISAPMLLVGFIGSFSSLVVRWRTAGAVQREQMKWVLGALAFAALPFLLHDWAQSASDFTFTITLPIVPVAVAVSVLRYRLYDIDRIVSRAVSYLVVTGLLVGVYVGCIAMAEAVLPVGSSSLTVAASTLAVAALFQPVRRRVQATVDHRFNRERYDAARTIDAFAGRLRDEVDPDVVRHDLLDVTVRAIQPTSISLWVAS